MSTGFNMFTMPDPVLMLLFVISAYPGPFLAALVVTRAVEGKEGVRRLQNAEPFAEAKQAK